ncbi:hypothetical protein ACFLSA_05450 [Bacteroidota bacterium]
MNFRLYYKMTIICLGFILASTQIFSQKTINIIHDGKNKMIRFAVEGIQKALEETGYKLAKNGDVFISFEVFKAGMDPQSFRIQREGERGFRIYGGDTVGLMYGGLELAEMITLGGGLHAIEAKARKPYILRRGLKFNITFDGRTPSYDDRGDAAQKNILTVWDFEFWKHYLETMVHNRYNVLTLWTTHPYGGIVKLPEYPGVNFDNVARLTREAPWSGRLILPYDLFDPDNYEIIKEISLEDKIKFWTGVFNYAEDLGIEIYMFHWNICAWGAEGKYGITHEQDNAKTIEYVRYAMTEFLKTYPQIDGIGVTGGERVDRNKEWSIGIEEWMLNTYGKAIIDVLEENPDRRIRFIIRQHWSVTNDLKQNAAFFDGYNVEFNTSFKYVGDRMFATTTSSYLDIVYREKLEPSGVPCWMHVRNDDVFVHRWGNPDYAREFLQNLPRDLMKWEAGYYIGSDSYVWGKEFIDKDPKLSGQWEIDKHWFNFMMWGRLGYDITLSREYFEKRLSAYFPQCDPTLLYDTWAISSQVVSWVTRFFFHEDDAGLATEGCIRMGRFLTIDESFFRKPPIKGSGILSVQEYADAVVTQKPFKGLTPFDVADNLDKIADKTLTGVEKLKMSDPENNEYQATVTDMESIAILGSYYADKIRGAAELAVYRADSNRTKNHQKAVDYLSQAVSEWENYAEIASGKYKPQKLSRTYYLDWWKLLEEVKKEVETVRKME